MTDTDDYLLIRRASRPDEPIPLTQFARLPSVMISLEYIPAVVLRGTDIDLTGSIDCTAALRAKFTAGLAAGAKRFVGVHGATYKIAIPDSETLATFTGTSRITVDMANSKIDNSATSYTADTVTPMFKLDGATDTTIRVGEYLGYTLPAPETYLGYRGATLVQAINACDGVKVEAKITNARYGVQSGDYADPTRGENRNFDIRLRTSFCGYPVALYLAHNIRLDIDADDIHRGAYLAGVQGVTGDVRWRNQYIADIVCLITDAKTGTLQSRGSSNINITSTDRGSTVNTVTSTMCAGIALSRVDACVFRNIKVRVSATSTDTVSRYTGGFEIISGAKVLNPSDYSWNWTSSVVLDNIEITGVMDQSAMTLSGNVASGGVYLISYDTDATHAATVRNLKIKDFVHLPSSGNTRSNYVQVPVCISTVLDNMQAPGVDLALWTAGTGDVTLRDSRVKDLAGSGSVVTLLRSSAVTMDTTSTLKCFDSTIHGAGGTNGIVKHVSLTLSGASTSWAAAIPQGAFVKSVQSRVTTTITGASSFSIGVAAEATRYGNSLALSAGTTSNNRSWSATEAVIGRSYLAATDIVLTANGSNFTGGVVHLMITYELSTNLAS